VPLREAYSPEEAAELNGLLDALPAAITFARGLFEQLSVQHPSYLAADLEVSTILARIQELLNRKYTGANDNR
jgi:hypothetical protein